MYVRPTAIVVASAAVLLGAAWALADRLEDTFYVPLDHPAIRYDQEPDADPVARFEKRLRSGEAKLEYTAGPGGYLAAVLKEFNIPIDSQVLVFSKTSIQAEHINPRTPRAIYFNDQVSVGYVVGGDVLEISALDPERGVYLYSLDARPGAKPGFARRDDCLRCHQGPITLGVPGILVSSMRPRAPQSADVHGSSFITDHRTPFEERWGGWYVTGTHGKPRHLGNNLALINPLNPGPPTDGGQNLAMIPEVFDASKYLTNTSDVVALLTLEHQSRMTNLMTRVGWDTRIAERDGKLKEKTGDALRTHLHEEIEELVIYMLFADEAPLKEPVAGVSTFTQTFPQRGRKDAKGRSLREFDLKTRLFRYPLSYMIYSPAFDGMPASVRVRVYQRLFDILTGKDQSRTFAKLSAADRQVAMEILRDTKPGLPEYWATPSTPVVVARQ